MIVRAALAPAVFVAAVVVLPAGCRHERVLAGVTRPAAAPDRDLAAGARFTALTPTLVRLEYAGDGSFEDRPSFNVLGRDSFPGATTSDRVVDGWRIVCTDALCIHYQLGSGPFAGDNLYVEVARPGGASTRVIPDWSGQGLRDNLGGWLRSLDGLEGGAWMHNGPLTRLGWCLLDDSATALWDGGELVAPANHGQYQSGYFFSYGTNYKEALTNLSKLTGPVPLLPRWAFGLWYSRYFPYTQSEYMDELVPRFRREHVPLDVLVVDTDWKAPADWNGWGWNPLLFPDPARFFAWAQTENLNVTLNVHPSISRNDLRYPYLSLLGHGLYPIEKNYSIWDWGDRRQVDSYFAAHQPFEDLGVRFWWLDWCCEPGRDTLAGTTPDTLINFLYAERSTAKGQRGFAFSRIGARFAGYGNEEAKPNGAWAEHRYTVHFTGDTHPTWKMLRYQAMFTIREGNMLLAYVSHDIGSFFGTHLADELYMRWIQLGTFQPIMRLHSHHGDRLPWEYGDETRQASEAFLRLRQQLSAYVYTAARQAHDAALPIVRGLYLEYPERDEPYRYDTEYMFGDALLVAPIVAPSTQPTDVWLPPGKWYQFFRDEPFVGNKVYSVQYGFREMPLFVRAGSIVPLVPDDDSVGVAPPTAIIWHVYPGAPGRYRLYDDAGEGLGYLKDDYAFTEVVYEDSPKPTLTLNPTQGSFASHIVNRVYTIVFHGIKSPAAVKVDGQKTTAWSYDADTRRLTVRLGATGGARAVVVQPQ